MPRGVRNTPRAEVEAEGELCREHFPEGWDTPHVWPTHTSVACEHGQWTRDIADRAAAETPKAVFDDDDEDDDE